MLFLIWLLLHVAFPCAAVLALVVAAMAVLALGQCQARSAIAEQR